MSKPDGGGSGQGHAQEDTQRVFLNTAMAVILSPRVRLSMPSSTVAS